MSQKGEKYARRMERRVDKLEQNVAAITTEQTTQGVRISAVEDDLAVYRAAVSARELKQAAAEVKAAKERRTARAAERERKARRRNKVLAFIALALFVAVCVLRTVKCGLYHRINRLKIAGIFLSYYHKDTPPLL